MSNPRPNATNPLDDLIDARERFVGYVVARVSDPELAEDIVQDALLKAVRAEPPAEERLIPWFYRVLRNSIVDAYRHRAVERRHVAAVELPELPEEQEWDQQLCDCFKALLADLRPDYARLIEMIDLGQVPRHSAAEQLGLTMNNLKVRHHRARQALRRSLEATCRTCSDHGCLDCTCEKAGARARL